MNARAACAAFVALALALPVSAGANDGISLAALEQKLPQAPIVVANQYDVQAAQAALDVERAKNGLSYTYSAGMGPTSIIVPRSYDYHSVRFEQSAGVSMPLLGSRSQHIDAIASAQEKALLAQIALEQTQRERLAALRTAYIKYWQFHSQERIALAYAGSEQQSLGQAKALRETGFWTSANLLDFLDTVQKVKTDAVNFASSARGQLAQVDFAMGTEIPAFVPMEPDFFDKCSVDRSQAIASAQVADATLAEISAQTAQIRTELAAVRWAPVEGNAAVQAGSVTDITQRVSGYAVQATVNLSVPTHMRAEEVALRRQYQAQLQSLAFQAQQRKVEIASAVDAALDEVHNAQASLRQSQQDRIARAEDLRKAVVRFDTLKQPGSAGFDDVQVKRDELYVADTASTQARANVLLDAATLMLIAPGACGAGEIARH
jgi:outer membrane protein TolC